MFGVFNVSGIGVVSRPGDMIPIDMFITAIDVGVPVVRQFLE